MNHQKEDVLPKAEPIWVEILSALTSIDTSIFNQKRSTLVHVAVVRLDLDIATSRQV